MEVTQPWMPGQNEVGHDRQYPFEDRKMYGVVTGGSTRSATAVVIAYCRRTLHCQGVFLLFFVMSLAVFVCVNMLPESPFVFCLAGKVVTLRGIFIH